MTAGTYWARRGRERGPPSRNPQRNARCWTWWRSQRRQHSDQTPAWKALKESARGVDQTLETERQKGKDVAQAFTSCHTEKLSFSLAVIWKIRLQPLFPSDPWTSWFEGVSGSTCRVRALFLYIAPMVTDPKHNTGTFFPTRLPTRPLWMWQITQSRLFYHNISCEQFYFLVLSFLKQKTSRNCSCWPADVRKASTFTQVCGAFNSCSLLHVRTFCFSTILDSWWSLWVLSCWLDEITIQRDHWNLTTTESKC